jgi:50S ribosomal protein L16 3-hydroxylase
MPAPAIEVHARNGQLLGMSPARFLRDYWQKRPLLIRNAFPAFQPPLTPDDLAGLACMQGALARIVLHKQAAKAPDYSPHPAARPSGANGSADARSGIRSPQSRLHRNDGEWVLRTGPFDETVFAQLPESNWTLLVQDVDKWDADTAALLAHFAFIPSWRIDDVMISYATDNGGVGAHVDQYDVFLLQGSGRRRWSIDARPHPVTAFRDDVELKLLREFHPSHNWILEPGDMLYLPPGVPHDGVAHGECTTWSIGMRAPAASELLFDFAAHVAEALPESQRFADPDLAPARLSGEIDAAAIPRARGALGPIAAMLDDAALADWFGSFITRYRAAQAAVPRKRALTPAALAARLPRSVVQRDPWTRFAWRRSGRNARLYAAGSQFDAPLAWARALTSTTRVVNGAALLALPDQPRGLALLAALANAGYIGLRQR